MRGYLCLSLVGLAFFLQYATAQWPKRVINKGTTCEDRCKSKLIMCDPVDEFKDCKCFPQKYVTYWLQYHRLPIDPLQICSDGWTGVVPKCCNVYKQQMESRNNQSQETYELNKKLGSQQLEMEELQTELGSKQQEMEELQTELGSKQQEMEELQTELGSKQQEMEELQKKLDSNQNNGQCQSNVTADMLFTLVEQNRKQSLELEKVNQRLDSEQEVRVQQNSKQAQDIEQLKRQNHNHSQELKERIDSEQEFRMQQNQKLENLTQAWSSQPWKNLLADSAKVAFSAWMGGPGPGSNIRTIDVASKSTVIFNRVHTNHGNGYNPATGMFTSPVAGTYLFSFSFGTTEGRATLFIKVDDTTGKGYQILSVASTIPNGDVAMAGNSAIVEIRKGQQVSVVPHYATKELIGSLHFQYTTFSGALLFTK